MTAATVTATVTKQTAMTRTPPKARTQQRELPIVPGRAERMELLVTALWDVGLEMRDDSWHELMYVDHNVGNLEYVVKKMCQLEWLHKYRLEDYQAAIKVKVDEMARKRGTPEKPVYYKGIYVDAATEAQKLPEFQMSDDAELPWMNGWAMVVKRGRGST